MGGAVRRRRPDKTTWRWQAGLVALVAGAVSLGTSARAATKKVRLVVQPKPDGTATTYLDRALPASEEFEIELPDPTTRFEYVWLDVWPSLEGQDCDGAPPETGRQVHRLGMVASVTADDRAFRAMVPPLEMGQTFCVRASLGAAITKEKLAQIATTVAEQFVVRLAASTAPVLDAELQADAARELRRALAAQGLLGDVQASAHSAVKEIATTTSFSSWLKTTEKIPELERQVRSLEHAVPPPKANEPANESRKQALDAAKKELATARGDLTQATAQLKSDLASAILRHPPEIGPGRILVRAASRAGAGAAPEAGSYASVDTGVAFGYPTRGNRTDTWWFPYVGVNLYFTPVERKVALDELVGGLRQRLSLTVGVTLTKPPINGREVHTLVFDRYPLVAAGCRLSHYLRLIVGTAFYKIADVNSLSEDRGIGLAPFFGLSVDADLVSIIKRGI